MSQTDFGVPGGGVCRGVGRDEEAKVGGAEVGGSGGKGVEEAYRLFDTDGVEDDLSRLLLVGTAFAGARGSGADSTVAVIGRPVSPQCRCAR